MIAVWLYSSDGRAMYCVTVPLPMPTRVSYAGQYFSWNNGRYVQEPAGTPRAAGPEGTAEAITADAAAVAAVDMRTRAARASRLRGNFGTRWLTEAIALDIEGLAPIAPTQGETAMPNEAIDLKTLLAQIKVALANGVKVAEFILALLQTPMGAAKPKVGCEGAHEHCCKAGHLALQAACEAFQCADECCE